MIVVRRKFVTLIEMMIVMFLIALITGVVAYNYRATLEKGRAFKTEQGIEKVRTILLMATAEEEDAWQELESGNWKEYVKDSPLARDWKTLVKDGWGVEYQIEIDQDKSDIEVTSDRYENYLQEHGQ